MANQTKNRNQVFQFNPATRTKQKTIDKIGVNGTPGAWKPRLISECL